MVDVLRNLNDEQKRAVTSIDGAYRLMAGAGSGKTSVLTNRLAYISYEKELPTERILCVTFTKKAAHEMKKRASDIMGRSMKEYSVMTFHSLARDIFDRDHERLGFKEDYHIAETPLAVLVKEYVDAAEKAGKIKVSGNEEKLELQRYLTLACREALSSGDYVDMMLSDKKITLDTSALLTYYRAYLERDDAVATIKGSLNKEYKKKAGCTIPQAYYRAYFDGELTDEIRQEFDNYQSAIEATKKEHPLPDNSAEAAFVTDILRTKQSLNTVSYDDLITFALYLLKDEEILTFWQDKYDYIQVDEFQDTDRRQLELVELLYAKHGNLFVVGDADQSIYRFRGANPELFVNLDNIIPDLQTITMNNNYRSDKKIVKAANEVIRLSKNRIIRDSISMSKDDGLLKVVKPAPLNDTLKEKLIDCISRAKDRKVSKKVLIEQIPEYRSDMETMVSDFEKNIESIMGKRKSSYDVESIMAELIRKGSAGCAVDEVVKEIDALVGSGESLNDIAVLYRDRNDSMLTSLYYALQEKGYEMDTAFTPKNPVCDFIQTAIDCYLMYQYTKDDGYLAQAVESLTETDDFGEIPLEVSLEEIKKEEDIFSALALIIPVQFHKTTGNPIGNYRKWLMYEEEIKELIDERKALFDSLSEEERVTLVEDGEEEKPAGFGIHIMTMHKAKGLEWKYVFVLGLSDDSFPKNSRNTTIIDGIYDYEEQNRLAYVAFSRAQKCLYLCMDKDAPGAFVQAVLPDSGDAALNLYQKEKMYHSVGEIDTFALINDVGHSVGYIYQTVLEGERYHFVARTEDMGNLSPWCSEKYLVDDDFSISSIIRSVPIPKEDIPAVFKKMADTNVLRKILKAS